MAVRVLVDTNVLLDYLLWREPYADDAREIIVACKQSGLLDVSLPTLCRICFLSCGRPIV